MDQPRRVILSGVGHFHPENKIENSFFDELDIGSDAQWVMDRTGIGSRRSVLSQADLLALKQQKVSLDDLRKDGRVMSIAEMALPAWQLLRQRHRGQWRDPETLICGTSVPDFDIPANACTIGHRIGIDCVAMDVNSACSSFVVNLHVANAMLKSGATQKVAIFNPERYSLRLNYNDRASCVLFGDGCAATTLEVLQNDCHEGLELIDTIVVSAPSKFDLIQIPENGHFYQNGKAVQKFAISKTIGITEEILARNGLTMKDVGYLIGHQANLRMLTAAMAKLGIPEERHLYNVDKFGNQGAAGAPSVLSMNWDKYRSGDVIVVSVVGSGLTWASALFRAL